MVTTSQPPSPARPPAGGSGATKSSATKSGATKASATRSGATKSSATKSGETKPAVTASGSRQDGPGRAAGEAGKLRLTGRGAVILIFALCLFGAYVAEESHWTAAAGVGYVAACAVAARYVKSGYLLVALVTPPLLFAVAVTCVKAATATGTVLTATTEGTLLTLGTSAPWLLGGTLLALVITLIRGLHRDIRELRANLRGSHSVR